MASTDFVPGYPEEVFAEIRAVIGIPQMSLLQDMKKKPLKERAIEPDKL